MSKRKAIIDENDCVACGCCIKACPFNAITVKNGCFAKVDLLKCVGCGLCSKICPACVITIREA